ncbi:MAG: LacI family transcriptional regulator [Treponema sp.]|jgi:DNA-binding LacI/PurR family transcriptional regulator|nr:LacI family transcriptional regulator [Treponema sp.]
MIRPTIQQIAKALSVSPATVSKALADKAEVSEETRARVLACARELGYIHTPHGGVLNGERRVAILIQDRDKNENEQSFYYDVLMGFKQYATLKHEVIILTTTSAEQEQVSYDAYLTAKRISGAFVMGLKTTDPYIAQLETTSIPTVTLDFSVNNPCVGRVGVDNYTGARLAVEHLIDLGHQNIGFLNGHPFAQVSEERLAGYIAALCSRKHGFQPGFEPHFVFDGDFSEQSGASGADYFAETDITALFCASDLMAMGAVRRFQEKGIAVPADISIVGFDNMPFTAYCTPRITTVVQKRHRLGLMACALLYSLLDNAPLNHCLLQPSLLVRESTTVCSNPGNQPVQGVQKVQI